MLKMDSFDQKKLIDPLFKTSRNFWVIVVGLSLLVLMGVILYIQQIQQGLAITGMNRPVYWGLYMVNFVFFIGLSLAGTFTSAILRLTGVEWRRPITRLAEAITVFALAIAGIQIMIDMGRPDRLTYIMIYGRLQSPILWDVNIMVTYLLSSAVYLFLPLIPDIALIRDNMPQSTPAWRKLFYQILALGWRGNAEQWRRLEKVVSFMAVFIIPVAISVHTITSWLLATTVQPGWHSTVFGPYFVVTAIFSGISAIFVLMTVLRETLGLEDYITLRQYKGLSWLYITAALMWFYFTYTETLTLIAGQQLYEFPVLASKLWGGHAFSFWLMIGLISVGFMVMLISLLIPRRLVNIAMFQARYTLGAVVVMTITLFLLRDPQITAQTSVEPFSIRSFGWTIVIFTSLVAVLGFGVWLKGHPIATAVIAGSGVIAGTWIERWNIIVPTLTRARMIEWSSYAPTLTEIGLTVASVALFILMSILFFKLFPAVSIWEIAEGRVVDKAHESISIPVPEPSSTSTKEPRWKFK
jgi:molybdopterin-containing oxidoreductase family membrane subunit